MSWVIYLLNHFQALQGLMGTVPALAKLLMRLMETYPREEVMRPDTRCMEDSCLTY